MAKILLGPWDTDGRRLLAAFLETHAEHGRGQAWLATVVGVSQPTVSDWKAGKKRPEAHHRKILCEVAGIPEAAWLSPEEQEAIRLACERFAPLATTGTEG